MKDIKFIGGLALLLCLVSVPTFSPSILSADDVEEVVAVGTRREARSVGDSPAPVDVITGSDFFNQGSIKSLSQTVHYILIYI